MENENKSVMSTDPTGDAQQKEGTPDQRNKGRFGLQQLLPILFIGISIVWIYKGVTEFGLINPLRGGTAATLPVLCAAIMLVASIISLVLSFKEKAPKLTGMCFVFLLLCALVVAASYLLGLLPALLIFVFIWVKFVEKDSWKGTLTFMLIMVLIGYGLFDQLLQVPFPQGILGNLLFP